MNEAPAAVGTSTHYSKVYSKLHSSKARGPGRPYEYVRPWISLSAKWLADAGFSDGDSIVIRTSPGRLVIQSSLHPYP